nr:MAG TPA: hypothetical protein [Caudoviricetes sp.]
MFVPLSRETPWLALSSILCISLRVACAYSRLISVVNFNEFISKFTLFWR